MGGDTLGSMAQAELQVLVPYATDFSLKDLEARIASDPDDGCDEATGSHQMATLDEVLSVLVVLKTPGGLEELQPWLSHLTINLEVQAFGSESRSSITQSTDGHSAQPLSRDVIWSGPVNLAEPPVTINDGSSSALVWSLHCPLSRPRVRMQHPMISFRASGTFRQPPSITAPSPGDKILSSGVPASINVLEPLSGDRDLQGITPQLTALRLDRISTPASLKATEQSIRSKPQNPFPALPAISARVRYSKSGPSSARLATIASLDIETSPFQDEEIELTDVNMQLAAGSAEDLCAGHAISLPKTCQPQDDVVFLFRLVANNDQGLESRANSLSRALEIWINARVSVSNQCRPTVQMRWRTTVDFSTALNPGYGGPSQAMQRNSRPSSLPLAPDTVLNSENKLQQRATAMPGFGVTMTLTAPREVSVGQPFTWDVFLVNRSDKARKLAILVIPKRKVGDHQSRISKTSTSSTAAGQRHGIDHADAVMDENRLYSIQKGNSKDAAQIVCLSTDVRIGYA
ncbi:MAG: hypothetical protein L6R38_008388 [Xanthoria sp. 2 TBL-2021]|nr:MAG: hypothetical protein L6R38_008388 [Xanthoria sp. 2 TBL-2021]